MEPVTVRFVAALDGFWEQQDDPIGLFDLWRSGRASLLFRVTRKGDIVVEAVTLSGGKVHDAPKVGTGQYL